MKEWMNFEWWVGLCFGLIFCGSQSSVPAPGYRYYTSGVLGGIGHYGYSWSSTTNRTVSGIYGRFLWFNSQGLDPSDANDRATGRQLRCLSE